MIAIPPNANAETRDRIVARTKRLLALFSKGWDLIPLAEHEIDGCAVISLNEVKPGKPSTNVNPDPAYLVLIESQWKLCPGLTRWTDAGNMLPHARETFPKLEEWYEKAQRQLRDSRPPQEP